MNWDELKNRLKRASTLSLSVKVIPKSSKTEWVGTLEGPDGEELLKVKVSAVPEKGKANEELCHYFAKMLGLRKSQVKVVSGLTSQRKRIELVSEL